MAASTGEYSDGRWQARVEAAPTTTVRKMPEGDCVVLDLTTEKYFGLDPVATAMWEALTTSPTIEAAAGALLDRFEVEEGQLRADLMGLVHKLAERKLISLI